jgi:hypothetical protein
MLYPSEASRKPLEAVLVALSLECRASMRRLLPYPLGLLGTTLVASGLDRAVLEESVLVYPAALVVGRDDVPDHLYAPVLVLEGGAALLSGRAQGIQDRRRASLTQKRSVRQRNISLKTSRSEKTRRPPSLSLRITASLLALRSRRRSLPLSPIASLFLPLLQERL